MSELHPERLSREAQSAIARVLASSRDPLDARARALLEELVAEHALALADAAALLPHVQACFDRMHEPPRSDDYETLLATSPEMAWIATEGNAFNHATDCVADIDALARAQRALDRPIKAEIEMSRSGRFRQTAFAADSMVRTFRAANGALIERSVPGSFFEFITRAHLDDGRLDLAFDAGNAQAIFGMTDTQSTRTTPAPNEQ